MGFILCQNNNIVGVFESFLLANNMALGIIENGWSNNFKIIEFKKNSCIKINSTIVKGTCKYIKKKSKELSEELMEELPEKLMEELSEELESSSEEDNCIVNNDMLQVNDDMLQENKKKIIETKHEINMLKLQKNRIEETKYKYIIDLDLYYKFKNNLEEDSNFKIPELFIEKYKLFDKLEKTNKLTCENFNTEYKEIDFHGNISNIFKIDNPFENKFLENEDSDEEIIYNK